MKLSEIIKKIDKSKEKYFEPEELIGELNINDYCYVEVDKRIKQYPIFNWLCTDTHVGFDAVFLDDELVYITYRNARKSRKEFHWVSEEAYLKTKKYIENLIQKDDEQDINIINFDEEWDDLGEKIQYSAQLLTDKVYYNNKLCDVVKEFRNIEDIDSWKYVIIKVDGENKKVPMNEVKIPYNILK